MSSNIPLREIEGNVSVTRDVHVGGDVQAGGSAIVKHNLRVDGWLDAPNVKGACKGLFASVDALVACYPEPDAGSLALVGASLPASLYVEEGGAWKDTGSTAGGEVTTENAYLTEEVERLTEAMAAVQSQGEAHTLTLDALQAMAVRSIDISVLDNPLGLDGVQEWMNAFSASGSYTFAVTDATLGGRCVGHMTLYADPYPHVQKLIHQCFLSCYAITEEGSLGSAFYYHPRLLFRMRAVTMGLTDPYTGDTIPRTGWGKWHDLGEETERRSAEKAEATAERMVTEAADTLRSEMQEADSDLDNKMKGKGSKASAFDYPFLRVATVMNADELHHLLDNFCTCKDALDVTARAGIYKRMPNVLLPYVGTIRGAYKSYSLTFRVEQYMLTYGRQYMQTFTGAFALGDDGRFVLSAHEQTYCRSITLDADGVLTLGGWEALTLTDDLRSRLGSVQYIGTYGDMAEMMPWFSTAACCASGAVLVKFEAEGSDGYLMQQRTDNRVRQHLHYAGMHMARTLVFEDATCHVLQDEGSWSMLDADGVQYNSQKRWLQLTSGGGYVGKPTMLPLADMDTDGLIDKASWNKLQALDLTHILTQHIGTFSLLPDADAAVTALGVKAYDKPLYYGRVLNAEQSDGVLYFLTPVGADVVQTRLYRGSLSVRVVTYYGHTHEIVKRVGAWHAHDRLRYVPDARRMEMLNVYGEVEDSLVLPSANYATDGVMTKAQAISLANVEALMLSMPTHEDVEHLYREIDWANDYIEMVRKLYDGLGGLEAKMHVDEENGVLVVTQNGRTWVCSVEEQVKPLSPIMPPTQTFVLTGGSYTLSMRAPTAGSEVYYTTDGSDPREGGGTPGTGVTIAVDLRVECTEHTVRAACKKSGMWSDVVTRVYYTYRRLPAPTFAIGGNSFDSERTVSISVQHGAQVNYGVYVGGERVMQGVYSGALTVTEDKTVVKAHAEKAGWHSSVEVSTGEIRMDVPVIRFGFADSVTSEADISSLPYTKKQENAAGYYEAENHTGGFTYLWLCIGASQTLGSVTSSGYPVPMEDAVVIGDYKVYRSSSTIEEGVMTFKVS